MGFDALSVARLFLALTACLLLGHRRIGGRAGLYAARSPWLPMLRRQARLSDTPDFHTTLLDGCIISRDDALMLHDIIAIAHYL